jgi:hypothetical protein
MKTLTIALSILILTTAFVNLTAYTLRLRSDLINIKQGRAKVVREIVLLENRLSADIYEPVPLTSE